MKVKLLRSRKLKRILFLECGKDFAENLLGLLVMPVGTMIARLGTSWEKDGNALYNLYASMKSLEDTVFSTTYARNVLINPAGYYTLNPNYGFTKSLQYGFVASGAAFIIGEDLSIARSSASTALQLLQAVESNYSDIESREIEVGDKEVLLLGRAAFASTTPLTDVFATSFREAEETDTPLRS